MARTDRFKGIVTKSAAFGGFIIAYIRLIPSKLAQVLDAPVYVGYQLSIMFALLIGLLLGLYYISSVVRDETDELAEAINEGEMIERLENLPTDSKGEPEESDDKVATDGGTKQAPNGTDPASTSNGHEGSENDRSDRQSRLETVVDRLTIEPSGKGALTGIVIGGFFGLLFGPNGIVAGGIVGGLLGNEVEYRAIQQKRESILRFDEEMSETGVGKDTLFEILKNERRRRTLQLLAERGDSVHISDILSALVTDDRTKQDIFPSIRQHHLPKMAEVGLVKYDLNEGTVKRGEHFSDVEPYLNTPNEPFSGALDRDELFTALKSRRRRYVLQMLLDEGSNVNLSDLAERVAALEHDKDISSLKSDERKRVYIALYQTHLPKLEQLGLVNYNQNRGVVSLREQISSESLFTRPAVAERLPFSWPLYYGSISSLAALVYVGYELGATLISTIALEVWFLLYAVLILTGSLYQFLNGNLE